MKSNKLGNGQNYIYEHVSISTPLQHVFSTLLPGLSNVWISLSKETERKRKEDATACRKCGLLWGGAHKRECLYQSSQVDCGKGKSWHYIGYVLIQNLTRLQGKVQSLARSHVFLRSFATLWGLPSKSCKTLGENWTCIRLILASPCNRL